MDTVLVTGGAGFIGSNIAEALIEGGRKAVVLDDLSTGRLENMRGLEGNPNFVFIQGSILDADLLRKVIREHGVSLISHQAARPSVAKSVKDPVKTTEINVTGTVNLFQAASECGIKRVVFASSSSVYGDTPQLPKVETMPFSPKSPYAVSKAAKEMYANAFTGLYGMEIIGLRYFNVYGRRQDPASDYAAVIPKFISKALRNEPIPIEGDGGQTRDFTYIDDVVAANINALTASGLGTMAVNIAFGSRISVLELARAIKEIIGSSSEIIHKASRPGDVRDSLADISKARKHIGYAPQHDIASGLKKTVDWFSVALKP